ncbi:Protein of unknown function [Gryllus bimaculatus]|nr:Protein of unknown function [Gryllus bimaculatus]
MDVFLMMPCNFLDRWKERAILGDEFCPALRCVVSATIFRAF